MRKKSQAQTNLRKKNMWKKTLRMKTPGKISVLTEWTCMAMARGAHGRPASGSLITKEAGRARASAPICSAHAVACVPGATCARTTGIFMHDLLQSVVMSTEFR